MALGFSELHQQVPLTKFLRTTENMKRNKIVILQIRQDNFFVHNALNHTSFLGS